MIIKPVIRANVFLNAHPLGCRAYVREQVANASRFAPFEGPKSVLIIGGSSGYGLASRIALTVAAGADTINVSYEGAPRNGRTGTAGWWHNIYFQESVRPFGGRHKDFIGDAFSKKMKQQVIEHIKATGIKLDLVIYSLAAGARLDESTNELVHSHIKTIGASVIGKTIDIATRSIKELTIEGATEKEIAETIFVMGGSDWRDWVRALDEAEVLNQGAKTISFTYVGGPTTAGIYRSGTLGKAKEDLEATASIIDKSLVRRYGGEALISSSKAVVTKASVFIPQMPIYVSCLFEVMNNQHIHETTLEHKYRLFHDMVYGNKRRIDEHGRLRIDHLEMDEAIQSKVEHLMFHTDEQQLFNLEGTKMFLADFQRIHGFGFPEIDYEADVIIDEDIRPE